MVLEYILQICVESSGRNICQEGIRFVVKLEVLSVL